MRVLDKKSYSSLPVEFGGGMLSGKAMLRRLRNKTRIAKRSVTVSAPRIERYGLAFNGEACWSYERSPVLKHKLRC
jgi:hypothetical protein